MTIWTASTFFTYFADCGPYLGDYPLLAPFPQNVPNDGDTDFIDFIVTDSANAAAVLDGSYRFAGPEFRQSGIIGDLSARYNDKNSGADATTAPAGSDLRIYVCWTSISSSPPAPSYDALTLVPPGFASGGTADGPREITALAMHGLTRTSDGVIIDEGTFDNSPSHSDLDYPFGQPACGVLADGTYIVISPIFTDVSVGSDNDMDFRAYHLDTDLSELGRLDFSAYTDGALMTTKDSWGTWAGIAGVVNPDGDKFLALTYNRQHDPNARGHSWVLDCSGASPSIVPGAYALLGEVHTHDVQDIGFKQRCTSSGDALMAHSSSGPTVRAFSFADAGFLYGLTVASDVFNLAGLHVNPGNADEYAVVGYKSSTKFNDTGSAFVEDATTDIPYVYAPIAVGNPYESGAAFLDNAEDDAYPVSILFAATIADPTWILAKITRTTADGMFTTSDQTQMAQVSPGRIVGVNSYRDNDDSDMFLLAAEIDYSGGLSYDTVRLELPGSIDVTTADSLIAGSNAIDARGGRVVVVCNVLENEGAPTPAQEAMHLVAWTLTASGVRFAGWGIHA